MKRVLAMMMVLSALLGAGVLTACGGGGGALTLEEYFAELQELDDTFAAESDELNVEFDGLTVDTSVDEVVDLLARQVDLLESFVNDLDDLNPPDEARDLHDEAVSAGNTSVDEFRSVLEDGRDAASIDELFLIFDSEELNTALDAFDQACLDAQALADENGIDVTMSCGE